MAHARAHLPALTRLAGLDHAQVTLDRELALARTALSDVQREVDKAEADVQLVRARAARDQGRIVPLERAIERGTGRVQIADAYWEVRGPDLPAGASVRIVGADGMTLNVEAVE